MSNNTIVVSLLPKSKMAKDRHRETFESIGFQLVDIAAGEPAFCFESRIELVTEDNSRSLEILLGGLDRVLSGKEMSRSDFEILCELLLRPSACGDFLFTFSKATVHLLSSLNAEVCALGGIEA
jgi:hypothetical protein